jgi:hypothetical protein
VVAATDDVDEEMIALGYDPQSVRDEVPAALRLKIVDGLATQGFVRYGPARYGPKIGSRLASMLVSDAVTRTKVGAHEREKVEIMRCAVRDKHTGELQCALCFRGSEHWYDHDLGTHLRYSLDARAESSSK